MDPDVLQDRDLRVIIFLERNPVEAAHTVHDELVDRVELVQSPARSSTVPFTRVLNLLLPPVPVNQYMLLSLMRAIQVPLQSQAPARKSQIC